MAEIVGPHSALTKWQERAEPAPACARGSAPETPRFYALSRQQASKARTWESSPGRVAPSPGRTAACWSFPRFLAGDAHSSAGTAKPEVSSLRESALLSSGACCRLKAQNPRGLGAGPQGRGCALPRGTCRRIDRVSLAGSVAASPQFREEPGIFASSVFFCL